MDLLLLTVISVVALALLFDFSNGFHDAANSVATVVATRAMPARWVIGGMVAASIAIIPATAAISWLVCKATQLQTVVADLVVGAAVVALLGAIAWAMVHAMGAREMDAELDSTVLPHTHPAPRERVTL